MTLAVTTKERTNLDLHNELIKKAEDLIPILKERSESADRDRRIPKETIQDMKDAGFLKGNKPPVGTGGSSQQLCPDGTVPPCKLPTTQIKKPVTTKNPFLSGFRAYDDGGEVVISSNVDKSLL